MFCQNRVEIITKTNEPDGVVRRGTVAESEILCMMRHVTVCVWLNYHCVRATKRELGIDLLVLRLQIKRRTSGDHENTLLLE